MANINFIKALGKSAMVASTIASTFFYGQSVSKFDRAFQAIYKAKKTGKMVTSKSIKFPGIEQAESMTAKKSGVVLYEAIIYTAKPNQLKDAGISVQSVYPKFATALVSAEDLGKLASMDAVKMVKMPHYLYPTNDISVAQTGAALLQAGVLNNTVYKGKGVLVGIFDSGNYFKHPDFRDAADQNKSRILRMWDQTITPTGSEAPPAGFTTGVEYTQDQINADLANGTAVVREADTNGHGSHVAGTAAGNGMALTSRKYAGMAPEANYIIVKGGNGSFSQNNVINALSYFDKVATALNMPIVVNMSIGGQYSPHDGTGPEEDAINSFTSKPGRIVTIAAGNENGTNVHKQLQIPAGGTQSMQFNLPDNTTATDLFAFLLYGSNNNDISATLTDPSGNTATVNADSVTPDAGADLGGAFSLNAENYVDDNNNDRYVDLYVTRNEGSATSSKGVWTLTLKNNGASAVTTDGWLYYTNKAFASGTVTITDGDSNYLIGSPGDSKSAITVAAYTGKLQWYSTNTGKGTSGGYAYTATDKQTDALSTFSSLGPLRDGTQKPDIAAPGEAVISVLSAGTITTASSSNVDGKYYQVMSGTSMATPATAGAVALVLQAKPTATASEVKSLLGDTAQKDLATGSSLPNSGWGYGKLDVFQAVSKLTGANKTRKTYINESYPYALSSDTGLGFGTEKTAERFSPDLTGYLGGVYFATSSTYSGLTSYTIEVFTNNNGVPGTLVKSKTVDAASVSRYNWNYFDLSDLKVPVTSGQDYFVVLSTTGSGQKWSLRTQAANTDGRSMISKDNGATWAADTVGYRIRSVVYTDTNVLATAEAGSSAEVKVYPNPVVDILKVQLLKNEKSSFKIYDMSGRLVKQMEGNSSNVELNVAALPKGQYLINIDTPSQKLSKKFLKN